MSQSLLSSAIPRARAALAASPIYEVRELSIETTDSALLIRGSVSSYYHKQLAQEVVLAVCRGIEVMNSIDVD